jgi:hypothetical protein
MDETKAIHDSLSTAVVMCGRRRSFGAGEWEWDW